MRLCDLHRYSILLLAALASPLAAQVVSQPAAVPSSIDVFLDCGFRCDEDFIRTEIAYVNWVRDRAVADVHILVTTQNTGGGGTEFTFAFLGQRAFAGIGDTLHYVGGASATPIPSRLFGSAWARTRVLRMSGSSRIWPIRSSAYSISIRRA